MEMTLPNALTETNRPYPYTAQEIRTAVAAAGVVGAGGAGFPTFYKLATQVDYVIANGAECEPLLRGNQELMEQEALTIVTGLEAVMVATGATNGLVALKKKYRAATAALEVVLKDFPAIELFPIKDFYPAGDEFVLVYETLGRVIPEAGLPLDVGVVVNNVETLYNVAKSLEGKPVTQRFITIAGWVKTPLTVKTTIGTPFQELIALAQPRGENYRVIKGGPMMGAIVQDLSKPVTKTTGGLIVLPSGHPLLTRADVELTWELKRAQSVCCTCTACTETCPRQLLGHGLKPHQIMKAIAWTLAIPDLEQALLCSECGLCETYACAMGLSPRRINSYLKSLFRAQNQRYEKGPPHHDINPWRPGKLIPTGRLINRLGLAPYDHPAPLMDNPYQPTSIYLPLSQHAGAPAVPIVEIGEEVQEGQLVAQQPADSLGANIHSGITGKVTEIKPHYLTITAG